MKVGVQSHCLYLPDYTSFIKSRQANSLRQKFGRLALGVSSWFHHSMVAMNRMCIAGKGSSRYKCAIGLLGPNFNKASVMPLWRKQEHTALSRNGLELHFSAFEMLHKLKQRSSHRVFRRLTVICYSPMCVWMWQEACSRQFVRQI